MQRKKGFTLIELLVVIAIIAILAAILFPVFQKVRENARRTTCISNMNQLGIAVTQYVQDTDEKYPIAFGYWNGNAPSWPKAILPYVKTIAVYQCPDDSLSGYHVGGPNDNTWEGLPISFAANGINNWNGNGFTFRGVFAGMSANGDWNNPAILPASSNPNIDPSNTPRSLGAVGRPADTIMLAEVLNQDGSLPNSVGPTMSAWYTNTISGYYNEQGYPNGDSNAAYPYGQNGEVSAPHGDKSLSNFLFVDGHVKTLRPAQTNQDPNNHPELNMWDATRQ